MTVIGLGFHDFKTEFETMQAGERLESDQRHPCCHLEEFDIGLCISSH